MFNLKTSVSEFTRAQYARPTFRQVCASRDVTTTNFANGSQSYKFETSGCTWWVPSKSFFRFRVKLVKGDGVTPLTLSDNIAPAMGLCSELYSSCEFRIHNVSVNSCSDFVAQTDLIENRTTRGRNWLDKVGGSTNFYQASFADRQNAVCSDGIVSGNIIYGSFVDRLALGYDALNTLQIAGAAANVAQVLTFAAGGGAAPPNTNVLYIPGDQFRYVSAGVTYTGVIQSVAGALTMTVIFPVVTAAVGAAVLPFSRSRVSPSAALPARNVGTLELLWQPPLSIFKEAGALPVGDYEFVMNPHINGVFQKRAIESLLADKIPTLPGGANADYTFQVLDAYLWLATIEGARVDDAMYLLDMEESRCQVQDLGNVAGVQQRQWDISPSTHALTIAFQDAQVGTNTLYSPSRFVVGGVAQNELQLNRMYISYAGEQKPSPDADPNYTPTVDNTGQRYVETFMNCNLYNADDPCESIVEWHNRGSFYYFDWAKDESDRSTRVIANASFAAGFANNRMLIFDHYHKTVKITIQQGRIIDCQTEAV